MNHHIGGLFGVEPDNLKSYDINGYHVIIDDLQSLRLVSYSDFDPNVTFKDVVLFIERVYESLKETDISFWCAVDEGQSYGVDVDNNDYVTTLFNTDDTTSRQLNIPIFLLNKILRNSVEVSIVVQKVRNMRITNNEATYMVFGNHSTGHRIR